MIKLKQIKPPTVDIWSRTLGFIGNVNEYEFIDLRVQIKNEASTDYFVYFNHEEINITPKGDLAKWPAGLFDMMDKQLGELFN